MKQLQPIDTGDRAPTVAATTTKTDGLMVLAYHFPIIATNVQKYDLTGNSRPYQDEGVVVYGGENVTVFEAIRKLRHSKNPTLERKSPNGTYSFMEWDMVLHYELIKNMTGGGLPEIQLPLEKSKGGLGYYDNIDIDTRRRQGELARRNGVDGFIYYTQAVSLAWDDVLHARLEDGHPAGPFAVMAVDEGRPLGNRSLAFFGNWLRKVIAHPDYIRVDGRPVVYLYVVAKFLLDGAREVSADTVRQALNLVEREAGSPLYWIGSSSSYCIGKFPKKHRPGIFKELDAWTGFAPHGDGCMKGHDPPPNGVDVYTPSYLTGWYPAPRGLAWFNSKHKAGWKGYRPKHNSCGNTPERFYQIMHQALVYERCSGNFFKGTPVEDKTGQLWNPLTLFAWNEWGEQAVLEPSLSNGFSMLDSMKRARRDASGVTCPNATRYSDLSKWAQENA